MGLHRDGSTWRLPTEVVNERRRVESLANCAHPEPSGTDLKSHDDKLVTCSR
jgi:hypothetical protein